MNTEHIGLDELADSQAGLVTPERAAEISAHLTQCDPCSTLARRLDRVGQALASAGTEPMPDDVAARLSSAVTAERGQAANVLPLAQPKAPRQIKWAGLSAVAAVIALVVAVVAGHEFHHSSTTGGSTAASAPVPTASSSGPNVTNLDLDKVEHGTGTAYNSTNLVETVSQQLRHPAAPLSTETSAKAAKPVQDAPDSTSVRGKLKKLDKKKSNANSQVYASSGAAGNGVPAALHALMQPKQLLSCIEEIDGPTRTNIAPSSIDFSTYDKQPAAVILFTAGPGDDDAYVVGPACGDLRRQTPQSPQLVTADLLRYQEIPIG